VAWGELQDKLKDPWCGACGEQEFGEENAEHEEERENPEAMAIG